MKKTFKIGEYAVGGIIKVEYLKAKEIIVVEFLDYFTKEIVLSHSFNTNQLWEMEFFIDYNCTSFWADKITNYVKSKL